MDSIGKRSSGLKTGLLSYALQVAHQSYLTLWIFLALMKKQFKIMSNGSNGRLPPATINS